MKPTLEAGMEHTHRYVVPKNKTVPHVFEDSELFQQMPPHMEEGEISLGTNICVSHLAPTPAGMKVEVLVKCLEVNGSKTRWSVVARDEKDVIGEGTHERFAINGDKFANIVAKKSS